MSRVTRVCWNCKRRKYLGKFSRCKSKKLGRTHECKTCCSVRSAIWAKKKNNRATLRKLDLVNYHKTRRRALEIVGQGRLKCRNCSCTNFDLLEINHIRGGGGKEFRRKGNTTFYRDIAAKRRRTSDLNILCKLCNTLYYLNKRYGRPLYKISFIANRRRG